MNTERQIEKSISLKEIRSLADQLFRRLEDTGVDSVPVRASEFWQVFLTDAFNAGREPSPVLADVNDCLADLREEVNAEVMIAWHALHHLSGLLTFLAKVADDNVLTADLPPRQEG
ncbi:hypothetical protein [Sinorhizobium fredii]|uniref:hypothetical protein n=1 Tax=Rhizobium fredii TaxID=380 RepID=UPI0011D1A71E|nr:hypothetical protein [Sinorhizobium fredii]WOS62703.1 hypothetical protein SFGR64A_17600 [Sinorhizobium fredii GR64]